MHFFWFKKGGHSVFLYIPVKSILHMPGQLFSQKMSQFQHTVLFSTPRKYSVFIYITALNSILKV